MSRNRELVLRNPRANDKRRTSANQRPKWACRSWVPAGVPGPILWGPLLGQISIRTHLSTEEAAWPPHSHDHSALLLPELLCFERPWFWGKEESSMLSAQPRPPALELSRSSVVPGLAEGLDLRFTCGKANRKHRWGTVILRGKFTQCKIPLYTPNALPP